MYKEILNKSNCLKLGNKLINTSILRYFEMIIKNLNLLKSFIFDIKDYLNNSLIKSLINMVFEMKEDFHLVSVLRIVNDDLKVDLKTLDLNDSIFRSALNFIINVSNNNYIKSVYY